VIPPFQGRCVLIFSWFTLQVCQNLTVRLKGVSAWTTEHELCASNCSTTPVFTYKYCNKPRQSGLEVTTLRIQYQNSSAKYICAVTINLSKPTGYSTYHQVWLQEFYMVITLSLCVVYGSQNKQRLFPYTAVTDLVFITEAESVYCAVRTEFYITQIGFVLKGF